MPLPIVLTGDDIKADSPIKRIVEEALPKVLILTATPTTANGLLPEGKLGFRSGTLYITISGNTYSISLTLL